RAAVAWTAAVAGDRHAPDAETQAAPARRACGRPDPRRAQSHQRSAACDPRPLLDSDRRARHGLRASVRCDGHGPSPRPCAGRRTNEPSGGRRAGAGGVPGPRRGPCRMTSVLGLDRVTVGYGEGTVLSDVSLDIAPGSALCLLGRNGVGKTTLVKTVVGLLRPRHGQVLFEGVEVTAKPPNQRARMGVGYVPQGRLMFPQLTVRENLLVGLEALNGGEGALDEVYRLFPVLKDMGGRLAGMLSGGQQQQLAIGRALVARPKLLLLDEPTEGIQPSIVIEIRAVLRRIREETGVAMLLAEQFLDFAAGLADDYLV